MALSYRFANRLSVVNRIPLVNRIFNVDVSRSEEKDRDFWRDEAYSKKAHLLTVEILGKPVVSLPYRISVGDIYLSRRRDKFFSLLGEMMDEGLIPGIGGKCRVFEPGCNVGAVLKRFQDSYNCEVYGMDISEEAIRFAETRLFENNDRARFFVGDVLDHAFFKRFSDDFFDLTVCVSHLVHVKNCEEKERYIDELKRVSKAVVFFEKINTAGNSRTRRNFEDYESKYGFKLFRRIKKKNDKHIGMYYYTKERID